MAKIWCPSSELLQEAQHIEEYNLGEGTNLPIDGNISANDMPVCNFEPLYISI